MENTYYLISANIAPYARRIVGLGLMGVEPGIKKRFSFFMIAKAIVTRAIPRMELIHTARSNGWTAFRSRVFSIGSGQ